MQVVGVIDLMGGLVVRAIAGDRARYRPLTSHLCNSCQPWEVARAFTGLGIQEIYIADLDAIAGAQPDWQAIHSIAGSGANLWLDAGIRSQTHAIQIATSTRAMIVVGLETFPHVAELTSLVEILGERIVFSLDLCKEVPLGGGDPFALAQIAIAAGVRHVLVLDLARVGIAQGPGAIELCQHIAAEFPDVTLSYGGGVRDKNDLEILRKIGIHAALVATALHERSLGSKDLAW